MSIAEKLQTVAENIPKVYDAGYKKGKAEGGSGTDLLQYATFGNGYAFRYAEFPDNFDVFFKVKGSSTPTFSYLFAYSNAKSVTLEMETTPTKVTFNGMFISCKNLVSVTLVNSPFYVGNSATTFDSCTALEQINGLLDMSQNANASNMFRNCSSLKDVRFVEGSIKLSLTLSGSPDLSDATVDSVVKGLADLTGQTSQDLSVHGDVFNRMTEEQKSIVANKNWTLSAVA